MKRLPKKITNEIRGILEKCQSGELKHKQSGFHCGTAHCIAGWKEVLDYAQVTKDASILTSELHWYELPEKFAGFTAPFDESTTYGYAQTKWRLTDMEAMILFSAKATFPEQFALLEKLERGERVQ